MELDRVRSLGARTGFRVARAVITARLHSLPLRSTRACVFTFAVEIVRAIDYTLRPVTKKGHSMFSRSCTALTISIHFAVTFALAASAAETKGGLDGFDAFMAQAMGEFKVPGVAVAVVRDGKIIFAKGYGYRDVERQQPVTGTTLFPIASITKSVTVTTLGTLADQGKLDWDKPVREYLPGFRMHDPVVTEQLTTRDMVTHRSGLPRHDLVWYSSSFTREQLVEKLRYLELSKPLRSKLQYNNLMFLTAGYLGGKIDGTSWEETVRQRVLEPLGMTSTKFSSDEARHTSDYALPYRKNWKTEIVSLIEFSRWGDVGPAGSMNSCIDDMAKYLLMHVNQGTVHGKQVLGKNNAQQVQSPQMVVQGSPLFPELGEMSYGMGLFIQTYRGHKHVSHGGNLDGFSAQFSFLPNDGVGVVVLTNLDGTFLRDLVPLYVYDRLLALESIDWVQRFREIERKRRDQELSAEHKGYTGRKLGTHPAHELTEYAGEFEHPGYGKLTIRVDSASQTPKLLAKLNDIERPLEHFHFETFQVPEDPLDSFEKLRFTFPTNAQGEIAKVEATLDTNVKEIVFTRVAEKRMFERPFLEQFAGDYDAPGLPWTIALVGNSTLQWILPGAPPRTLVPRHGTRFDVQDQTGMTLEFKQNPAGQVQELVIFTPDSAFAVPKKK
jgi:CubicO group peptidase (beta-lactamase class C family)